MSKFNLKLKTSKNHYNKNIHSFSLHTNRFNFQYREIFFKNLQDLFILWKQILYTRWRFLTHYYGFHKLLYPWCFPNTTSKCGKKKGGNLSKVRDVSMATASTQKHDCPLTQLYIFRYRGGGVSHNWPMWCGKRTPVSPPSKKQSRSWPIDGARA